MFEQIQKSSNGNEPMMQLKKIRFHFFNRTWLKNTMPLFYIRQATQLAMKNVPFLLYKYGTSHHSPIQRITSNRIVNNIRSKNITHQLFNNLTIAKNCTKIALKYSKCYLCRIPGIRGTMKRAYSMGWSESLLNDVDAVMLDQVPIPVLKNVFSHFSYENKGLYSSLALLLAKPTSALTQEQTAQVVKILSALEAINLGFTLHHAVGTSYKLNILARIVLKLMSKRMKESYLVLGGDYFHVKGSVLAAETYNVDLSKLMAEVEIDLCKYVHLTENLRNKIIQEGYDKVEVNEIFNISLLKISPLVKGLRAMDLISGVHSTQLQEAYESLSLIVLYRKDLENFMFNYKEILKKYLQYLNINRINISCEECLPYYIFFQGAQGNQRIDTAYLNTVTMMEQQIKFLKQKLEQIIGGQKMQEVQKRINYFMMVHL